MSLKAIQAVFFWRLNRTAFHAVYGRLKKSKIYTKDFLQSPMLQQASIDRALQRADRKPINLEFQWPGGSQRGYWRIASDGRGNLAWDFSRAPLPWRIGDPSTNRDIAIPGDGSHQSEAAAEAEWKMLNAANISPWLLATKFKGEDRVLHVSSALERPPAGLERHGFGNLPPAIREALETAETDAGFIEFGETAPYQITAPRVPSDEGDEGRREPAPGYTPGSVDTRALVERQIRERRGQQQFRNALRKRYGDVCAVTGCKILAILEAAHIFPYRGKKDNHVENGLLLRADIHTLFDLNLIGIEPTRHLVRLHPDLLEEYGGLDKTKLRFKGDLSPARPALQGRYKDFLERKRSPA
jgi:hypothetical protein